LPDSNPLSGVKVMVIDDSNTIRRSAEIFLLQAGCTVILAEDGFDALAKIADHQPDLVFVDIMMPRLDGMTFVKAIKGHEGTRPLPVIFLTAKNDPKTMIAGINLGARFYVTKPFVIDDLISKVQKALV